MYPRFGIPVLFVLLVLNPLVATGAPLSPTFYTRTCPRLQLIVATRVAAAVKNDATIAPSLLRILFHDCFVRGCDASIMLQGTAQLPAEMTAVPNQSVRGLAVIDDIKANVEAACPLRVSCADIIVLAAREAVRMMQGPLIPVGLGRRDGLIPAATDVTTLPSSHANVTTLIQKFQRKGLTVTDMVTLAGSHTVGKGLCTRLVARMKPPADPTLSLNYLRTLMNLCSHDGTGPFDPNAKVNLDPVTPHKFDNQYFVNLMQDEGLLTSDQTLMSTPQTKQLVERYAKNQGLFFSQFAVSLRRMSTIGILTGAQGQIRKNCRAVNGAARTV